jgi:hypothetical protein
VPRKEKAAETLQGIDGTEIQTTKKKNGSPMILTQIQHFRALRKIDQMIATNLRIMAPEISARSIAGLLNVSTFTGWLLLNGQRPYYLSQLDKLAKASGTTLDHFCALVDSSAAAKS